MGSKYLGMRVPDEVYNGLEVEAKKNQELVSEVARRLIKAGLSDVTPLLAVVADEKPSKTPKVADEKPSKTPKVAKKKLSKTPKVAKTKRKRSHSATKPTSYHSHCATCGDEFFGIGYEVQHTVRTGHKEFIKS
jgi:hypothetical protein